MNVSLTPELERYVQEKVQSGRYYSASEVVREALRALQNDEEARKARSARESRKDVAAKEGT
jgi:antitoxin ParD1/3/4